MTVYELEKQATPAPWKPADRPDISDDGIECLRVFSISDAEIAPLNAYGECSSRMRANAKLAAHCRNHFLRALEALKKAHSALEFPYEVPWTPEQLRNELCELITELEEVK